MSYQKTPMDRSLAYTALLEQDRYKHLDGREADDITDRFLDEFYRSGSSDMWSFSKTWIPEPEESGPAKENPYPNQYSPEYRAWDLAHLVPGLSDEDFVREVGWVPHDGTLLRDDLLAIYRQEEFNVRAKGTYQHAMDWAYNYAFSTYDTAEAYAQHVVDLDRAGDLTVDSDHTRLYPEFVAQREPELEA